MNEPIFTIIDSPLGRLLAVSDGQSLTHLDMQDARRPRAISPTWRSSAEAFAPLIAQLEEYFAGDRRAFDLPLAPAGNPFELRVWAALVQIPYGETASYGEIAQRIGAPGAARAVGLANGRNPIAVIIPCHRVIGANGSLTGYGGGLERKRLLLDLESGVLPLAPPRRSPRCRSPRCTARPACAARRRLRRSPPLPERGRASGAAGEFPHRGADEPGGHRVGQAADRQQPGQVKRGGERELDAGLLRSGAHHAPVDLEALAV